MGLMMVRKFSQRYEVSNDFTKRCMQKKIKLNVPTATNIFTLQIKHLLVVMYAHKHQLILNFRKETKWTVVLQASGQV